jgi:hypothetical protein
MYTKHATHTKHSVTRVSRIDRSEAQGTSAPTASPEATHHSNARNRMGPDWPRVHRKYENRSRFDISIIGYDMRFT